MSQGHGPGDDQALPQAHSWALPRWPAGWTLSSSQLAGEQVDAWVEGGAAGFLTCPMFLFRKPLPLS